MRNDKPNVIVEKTIAFSVETIRFCELLEQHRKYVVAKQLLRSATAIGANIFEAQNAESKADFIHKIKIAIKEANETLYWLMICEKIKTYPFDNALKVDVNELIRIMSRIILSSKRKV